MIFRKALWLIGAGMGLESMRRGFVGGSMLSLFVVKEFGLEKAAIPTMNALRTYLNIEEKLLSQIPPLPRLPNYPLHRLSRGSQDIPTYLRNTSRVTEAPNLCLLLGGRRRRMSSKKAIKLIERVCPICLTSYQTPKELPAPTCGDPNCIREARASGRPFTTPRRTASEKPENSREPAAGEP